MTDDAQRSPQPPQVLEGRYQKRRPAYDGGGTHSRPYFCRSCGAQQDGTMIPRGWYTIKRHTGILDRSSMRLGLYCSIACLTQQLDRITHLEAARGDAFDSAAYVVGRGWTHGLDTPTGNGGVT